ncbi:unnamed protein product [Blepharisma stoltei]|uniref:Uncharacterized protein n=1 Tax=Blepharisma stoltei TaxID=1481888 RepID=A0AAU9III6_9CILI|nr:unnamed protein product [Blepharisma stoltei]
MVKTYLSPPSTLLIFRGLNPSKFTFTMTPSLFLSEISDWPAKATGYYVSLPFSPEVGDTLTVEEINFEHGVVVTVFPDISGMVLVTTREYEQTLFVLFGTLLGSIFGLLQTGGLVMSKFEDGYNYVVNKIKEKLNFEMFGRNMERLRTIFGNSTLVGEFTTAELTVGDVTMDLKDREIKITQSVIL